jgi:hypothetical protein
MPSGRPRFRLQTPLEHGARVRARIAELVGQIVTEIKCANQ